MENKFTQKEEEKKNFKKEVAEWLKSIFLAVIIAVFIRMFIFETFLVDGSSMFPALEHSERLIVNKAVYYLKEPEHGDIIVFNYRTRPRRDFIKRVVALEGDKVEIKNGGLFINNNPVEEPFINNNIMHDFGPVTVPSDHLFVMGDNRNNSMDSRDNEVGSISLERVRGKALVVFWPPFQARVL